MRLLRQVQLAMHRLPRWVIYVALVVFAASLFALRYPAALHGSNFYAEDGTEFINRVYQEGYLSALFQPFNGYLVVAQYMLACLAVIIQHVLGLPFYTLPSIIAVLSCLMLGFIVSLPYLLFRRELGTVLALSAVIIGAFVPMHSSDYAIIGTIGNLKFGFLYMAFLLVLYRVINARSAKRLWLVDVALLFCVLTNPSSIFVLPFVLWPYRTDAIRFIRAPRQTKVGSTFLYALALVSISALYVGIVYLCGVPQLPGYLDSPYNIHASMKILYRVTTYAWFFPVSEYMNGITVLVSIGFLMWGISANKQNRFMALLGVWTILSATLTFVATRPGISDYYLAYNVGTTDQFFYGQSLIIIFMTIWAYAHATRQLKVLTKPTLAVLALYFIVTLPVGSSFGKNSILYESIGSARNNVSVACRNSNNNHTVTIAIYPSNTWQWRLPEDIACN